MLSQEQIKERLLGYVAAHPGCKTIEAAIKSGVIQDDYALDIPASLEQWVDDKELVEVTYNFRPEQEVSVYYPKGSNIKAVRAYGGMGIMRNNKMCAWVPFRTTITIRGQ